MVGPDMPNPKLAVAAIVMSTTMNGHAAIGGI